MSKVCEGKDLECAWFAMEVFYTKSVVRRRVAASMDGNGNSRSRGYSDNFVSLWLLFNSSAMHTVGRCAA